MTTQCPKCHKPVPDQAQFCPQCGAAASAGTASSASGEPLPSVAILHNNLAASRFVAGMLRYCCALALLVALIAGYLGGRFKALPKGRWALTMYIALGIAAFFLLNWIRTLARVGQIKSQLRQAGADARSSA